MYSIGVLTKNWKAKANIELIKKIKDLIKTFHNIEILKVKAHENDELNNFVDELAKKSIKMENRRV
jgi:ribonuclease HI